MDRTWAALAFVVLPALFATMALAEPVSVALQVSDSSGAPVPLFEANTCYEWQWGGWARGCDGKLELDTSKFFFARDALVKRCEVFIRAPGLAPCVVPINEPHGRIERQVTLTTGKRITLALHSDSGLIPESLTPIVYYPQHESLIRMSQRREKGTVKYRLSKFYPTEVTVVRAGLYTFLVDDSLPELCLFFDEPDFLREYSAGPFTKSDLATGAIALELPRTASLAVSFSPSDSKASEQPYGACGVNIMRFIPGSEGCLEMVHTEWSETTALSATVKGLLPGKYSIIASTEPSGGPKSPRSEQPDCALFRDAKVLEITAGEEKGVQFVYEPFNKDCYRGKYSATVKLLHYDRTVATGLEYALSYQDAHYGILSVQHGTIPANGIVEFAGLTAAETIVGEGVRIPSKPPPQFLLEVGEGELGRFPMHLSPDRVHQDFEFTLVPKKGDIAPVTILKDVFSGREATLSDFAGQLLFLEFWATWCGPCQPPMGAINEVARRHKEEWEGKVTIVGVSIDEQVETVRQQVAEKGWSMICQLWSGQGKPGFESDAAQSFGISGVPVALLLDKQRRILWRGNPTNTDPEKLIGQALAENF